MQTQIVQIGNSLGVRLPKAVLYSFSLGRAAKLDIQMRAGSIVLKPVRAPRSGWAAAFAAAPAVEVEKLWGDLPLSESWDGGDA